MHVYQAIDNIRAESVRKGLPQIFSTDKSHDIKERDLVSQYLPLCVIFEISVSLEPSVYELSKFLRKSVVE